MATPQVSGAAALAKAVFPNASGVGLKALLLRDVDPVAALNAAYGTGGRLNVDHAARCWGAPQAWIDSPANGTELDAGDPLEIRAVGVLCGSSGRRLGERHPERHAVPAPGAWRRAVHGHVMYRRPAR